MNRMLGRFTLEKSSARANDGAASAARQKSQAMRFMIALREEVRSARTCRTVFQTVRRTVWKTVLRWRGAAAHQRVDQGPDEHGNQGADGQRDKGLIAI